MVQDRHDWSPLPYRMNLGMRRQRRDSGAIESESVICNVYHFPDRKADPDELENALRRTVGVNPALRSAYGVSDAHGARYAELPLPPRLLEVDDSVFSSWDDLCECARELAAVEGGTVLDLRKDPPLRVSCLVGDIGFALVVRVDHSVCDGISYALFLRDLGEAYGVVDDEAYAAARTRPSLAEVAVAEREVLEGEQGRRLRRAWRDRLPSGVPEVFLGDRTPWRECSSEGGYLTSTVEGEDYRRHVAEAKSLRVTSFVLATAKILFALRPHVVNDELAFFCPFPGRFVPESTEVVGNFVNLLPVLVGAPRAADARATVGAVRDGVLWTMMHQGLPFDVVLEQVRDDDATGESLPRNRRSIFVAGYPEDVLDLAGERSAAGLPVMTTAMFDLSLWISDTGDRLRCMAVHRPRFVDADRLRGWLSALALPLE